MKLFGAFKIAIFLGDLAQQTKTTWDGKEFFFPACHEMGPIFLGGVVIKVDTNLYTIL